MTIKAILYDHDGTLVDSETVHFGIWQSVLDNLTQGQAVLDIDVYRTSLAGIPTPSNAEFLKALFGLEISAAELTGLKEQATQTYLASNCFPLMPGVIESMEHFAAQGLTLAVVTGAGREAVTRSLEGHNLHSKFAHVISANDVARSKPAPDCYLLAMEKLGLSAAQCIAIEDTEHGARSARDANIDCVVIPNSMSTEHQFEHATKVCDSMSEAVKWITINYQL